MTSTTSRFAYHGGTEAVIAPEEIRMSEQAFQPLLYAISADVVKRLVAGGMSLGAALGAFYSSQLYAALSSLRGIGVWTAEMLLLFTLQRLDVLSYGDLGIHRGMRMVYRHRKITKKLFEKYRRRLSPCGSIASLYFWMVAGGAIPDLTDPAGGGTQK